MIDGKNSARAQVDGLALDQLARLERAVIDAMSGSSYALEELQVIWSAVQLDVPGELAQRTRDDYLLAALEIWNRYSADPMATPEQATAALEVICLLFDA